MNHGHYSVYNNMQPLSSVIGSLPLINPSPFGLGVYQQQTSSDLRLRLYICYIHLIAMVYILHIYIYIYIYMYVYSYMLKVTKLLGVVFPCHQIHVDNL